MRTQNLKLKTQNSPAARRRGAFTLIELMIVVSILGIMAAIVLPELQGHTQKAKEATAKDNLRTLREAIERYYINNGVSPGYPSNDTSVSPTNKAINGDLVVTGNYLSEIPVNPFNNQTTFYLIENGSSFPTEPIQTDLYAWIYQPSTKTIKLNTEGTDSTGASYFDY